MKDTALQASRISPSPVSWRAVGIACYYVSDYIVTVIVLP